ncbi:MAG TPA: NADH-quinone oxidoreductase subunit C [Symbiobacteriaceae bacterium]|nr:NADH-quinone oxidoreductase subunit C [Symbiobacteriaceae bacterium]
MFSARCSELVRAGGRFITTVGTDRRPLDGTYEVRHLFAFDKAGKVESVVERVTEPVVESITPAVPAAAWAERELYDLLGITPQGHPDLRRLTVADDWPDGVFPLRRDVPHNYRPPAAEGRPALKETPPGATVVPVGPFFPTLEEPAYFRLFVEGERVTGCDYRGFYSHRGIEKLAETLHYDQVPFLAERICGICGFVHSTSFCQAVEQAVGAEVPLRALYIRTIMLELERIHSHLLWLGLAAHIVGFDTAFMMSWRVREPVMMAAEALTGNRKTYGMVRVGGVRRDISVDGAALLADALTQVEREAKPLVKAIAGDTSLRMRLERTGVLSQRDALERAVIGPVARASGIDMDVRRDFPYAAYDSLQVRSFTRHAGDIWARLEVRVEEFFESIRLIRAALAAMPDGPIYTDPGEIPPGKEGISLIEAPRGQCCHYVLTGEDGKPYRWRVLAPTYMLLQAVPDMLGPETTVADFPIIAGSVDPCFSCTERYEVIRRV